MLWKTLDLQPGVTSITGSGGKTTLAHCLAAELPGRVIFCTTTRILPSPQLPVVTDPSRQALEQALRSSRAVCTGTPADAGKLAAPALPLEALCRLADFILVEADGSRRLPLKAHLPFEPAVPPCSGKTILVVGASGFGAPIASAAHRAERFAALCGAEPVDPATPERVASVLRREGGFDAVVVNQVTDSARLRQAARLAALLPVPVFAGELRNGHLTRLNGASF